MNAATKTQYSQVNKINIKEKKESRWHACGCSMGDMQLACGGMWVECVTCVLQCGWPVRGT